MPRAKWCPFDPPPGLRDLRRETPLARHLAFGHGVHQCLGQSLARVELQVVFGTLCRRVPAADRDSLPFKHDSVVYGVSELPVRW